MTLALEWPDFEAEEKAKAKKARRKKTPDFIATDSDDEPKAKKKKRQERTHINLLTLLFPSNPRHSWITVPSEGKH
jgi:hypothetical protein